MNAPPVSVERVQKCVVNFEIYCFLKKAANLPHSPYHFLCFVTIIQVNVISGHQVKRSNKKNRDLELRYMFLVFSFLFETVSPKSKFSKNRNIC